MRPAAACTASLGYAIRRLMELGGHLSKTLYTRVTRNDTLLCPFWASVTGVPVSQLSESILASTRIAGGGERRRQVELIIA